MTRYILRRLLQTVPVLLGVSFLAFAIMHVVPGDPVRLIAGPDAPESVVQRVRSSASSARSMSSTGRFSRALSKAISAVRFARGLP